MDFDLSEEIEDVRKLCQSTVPDSKVATCTNSIIRVEIFKSKQKNLVVVLQFPDDYPNHEVLIELRSKTLDDKLIDGLTKITEEHARKYLGERQILLVLKFISKFLDDNPLCCCSSEISILKRSHLKENDSLKLKQKNSTVSVHIKGGAYFYNFSVIISNEYPEKAVQIETSDSNFPTSFCRVFIANSKEIARRCVEPPLFRKKGQRNHEPFQPKPSLLPAVKYIIEHVHRYPTEKCPCCDRICLPEKPEDVIEDENHDDHVERILCGHLYHLNCLMIYLKTPPFAGGKKCLVCKELVCFEKYRVPPRLAEARWAHQQARQREIDEVVEFLS